MDQIKFVIDELNQPPFSNNLNLIAYDSLRSEQRLDLLIQVLNAIDPKLNLPSVRVGNLEEIATVILDQLRIFKYTPPNDINPTDFRRDLLLGDKEQLTAILHWLLSRLSALRKRAYLARFLVRIELSPEVEGDPELTSIYQAYVRLIEDFKRAHAGYERQKRSLDSLIDLQKDIKTMEFEKDQIQNKLESVRRRVNVDTVDGNSGSGSGSGNTSSMFEAIRRFADARFEREKLQRQLREQAERIEAARARVEAQQAELAEFRSSNLSDHHHHHQTMSSNSLPNSLSEAEGMLARLEEDVAIKRRLAKELLPAELEEARALVRDLEGVAAQPADSVLSQTLGKVNGQIESLKAEIGRLMERKMLASDADEDRLSHYRQNAQSVAERKEAVQRRFQALEGQLKERQGALESLRAQFNQDGDLPVKGEALKQYIENLSKRDAEMADRREQLAASERELAALEARLAELKRQDVASMREVAALEEAVGIDGYFRMRESLLAVVADDNDDGIEDGGAEFTHEDIEPINASIVRLEETLDSIKEALAPLSREVKQLKTVAHELENEYDMKRRLYDAAAAGLETELSRAEAEAERLRRERARQQSEHFRLETERLAAQAERDLWRSPGQVAQAQPSGSSAEQLLDALKREVTVEGERQQELRQREAEMAAKTAFYGRQIEMWRDLKALFEIKAKILAEKREEKARSEYLISANYNHLVL